MGTMLRIAYRIYIIGVKVREPYLFLLSISLPFTPLIYIRGSKLPTHNINSRLLYGCLTTFYGGLWWIWLLMVSDADNGQRTIDNGRLITDNGQWEMDNGQWTMDNGQWTTIRMVL